MESMTWPPAGAHPGTLHYIPPNLSAFEPAKPLVRSANVNTLLWIGGMFDTLLATAYPIQIAQALGPTWSLATVSLGSSGKSWGVCSIAEDARDMGKIVSYFKEQRRGGKIVIMGHSTGCQDCMEYVVGAKADQRPSVDGIILQAPVSDREAIEAELPHALLQEANELALKMCREGCSKDAIPNRLVRPIFGRIAITAQRWLDIASPPPTHSGADDYFSSDLLDVRLKDTFGKLSPSTPLLILFSGSDLSVPPSVNKDELVSRWMRATQEGGGKVDRVNGGIIPGASHNLNDSPEPVVQDLVARVIDFIRRLDNDEFHKPDADAKI